MDKQQLLLTGNERGSCLDITPPDGRCPPSPELYGTDDDSSIELKFGNLKPASMKKSLRQILAKQRTHQTYFITLNISPKKKLEAKTVVNGKLKITYDYWGSANYNSKCQYSYWLYHLKRVHSQLEEMTKDIQYQYFFEHCKSGIIHVHGRVRVPLKGANVSNARDLKACYYREFKHCMVTEKHFANVQYYDADKWKNYNIKDKKTEQTTDYPYLTNVDEKYIFI